MCNIVGAALRGRPCVELSVSEFEFRDFEFQTRAATEGRPYNVFTA